MLDWTPGQWALLGCQGLIFLGGCWTGYFSARRKELARRRRELDRRFSEGYWRGRDR